MASYAHVEKSESFVDTANTNCGDIAKLIQEYGSGRRDLQAKMIADMYDSAGIMNAWYSSLSANQGRTVYIPWGHFDNIHSSAEIKMSSAETFVKKDSALSAKLDQIVLLAAKCM